MCGIAGIINFNDSPVSRDSIQSMTNAIAHRGPDAEGIFIEEHVALGHRRLSIIDLSAASNQPFTDNSSRYTVVFNGEIYNYRDVKKDLADYDFKTTGDTEVLIAAYAKWGAGCLEHFRGMFAFVIWDNVEKELFLARDPMGVKPLYFFAAERHFLFSSEVRSILASGMVQKKVSIPGLLEYFSYQSISYPYSIIEGIEQLEAGSWMKVKDGVMRKRKYWDITTPRNRFDAHDENATRKHIKNLLTTSVERRLVSDLPVSAFLSGGIDSTAIVGLMAEIGPAPSTFTVSFEEQDFDESKYAKLVAKKFNTRHTRIVLKPTIFLEEMQNALDSIDSPSGDGINTYVVSKAIRQQGMPVALSGIGGDELFAGYPIFKQYIRLQQKNWAWELPEIVRELIAFSILPGSTHNKLGRIRQIIRLDSCSVEDIYPIFRQILSPRQIDALTNITGGKAFVTSMHNELLLRKENIDRLPLLSQVSAAEYLGYTQHTLLKDTDQMSMAMSLEVREPFFDQDLVEFVLSVPDRLKSGPYPKSLLVESLKPLIPDEIVFRKKQGFVFPWNVWLRKDLRSFCDMHIKNIAQRPFIHGNYLLECWKRFLNGDRNIRFMEIWLFVVLEYWLQKNNVD